MLEPSSQDNEVLSFHPSEVLVPIRKESKEHGYVRSVQLDDSKKHIGTILHGRVEPERLL